jgi:hypothetical protein
MPIDILQLLKVICEILLQEDIPHGESIKETTDKLIALKNEGESEDYDPNYD